MTSICLRAGCASVRAAAPERITECAVSSIFCGEYDFPRVRVGIGRPAEEWDMKDWVLAPYATPELRKTMFDAYMNAADAIAMLISEGIEKTRQFVSKCNS